MASNDFIDATIAKRIAPKFYEMALMPVQLADQSQVILERQALVRLRIEELVFERRFWMIPKSRFTVLLGKPRLVYCKPQINWRTHEVKIEKPRQPFIRLQRNYVGTLTEQVKREKNFEELKLTRKQAIKCVKRQPKNVFMVVVRSCG